MRHGITIQKYNQMLISQNYVCAVCLQPETKVDTRHGKIRDLGVDHDHKTKRVRGLLCYRCNVAEGFLKGDIKTVYRLAAYLELYSQQTIQPPGDQLPEQPQDEVLS